MLYLPKVPSSWLCIHRQLASIKVNAICKKRIPNNIFQLAAIINDLPKNHKQEYEVLFEDSTYPNGYSDPMFVAQRYVISNKQKKSS